MELVIHWFIYITLKRMLVVINYDLIDLTALLFLIIILIILHA